MKSVSKPGLLAFELFLLVAVIFFVVTSFGYNARARLVPLLVGVPTLLLLVFQIGLDHVPALKKFAPAKITDGLVKRDMGHEVESPDPLEATLVRRELTAIALVIGLGAGLTFFGFYGVLPLFLVLVLRFVAELSWISTLVGTGAALLVLYAAFVLFLRIDPYPGIIPLIG